MHPRARAAGLAVGVVLVLASCESPLAGAETSKTIAKQFEQSGRTSVDLAEAVPGQWDRVCVIGPYNDNAAVRTTLGFDWDAQSQTSIYVNDGISLLLFVSGGRVVQYVEHPRNSGDFSNLT